MLYRDNGKENGNRFRDLGFRLRAQEFKVCD